MTPLHALAIFAAGIAAGTINTVVGSGTLITFPVLLAFGYAPVTANVTNAVGLVPGSAAGAVGYRRELRGQRRRAVPLLIASAGGAAIGAILLLSLPASAFKDIVPVFIGLAVAMIVLQPQLTRALEGHRRAADQAAGPAATAGTALPASTAATSGRRRASCSSPSSASPSTTTSSASTHSRSCWPDSTISSPG